MVVHVEFKDVVVVTGPDVAIFVNILHCHETHGLEVVGQFEDIGNFTFLIQHDFVDVICYKLDVACTIFCDILDRTFYE